MLLAIALQAASAEAAPLLIPKRLSAVAHCPEATSPSDVVVCGRSPDRYRLPLPAERDTAPDPHVRGEAASALTAITPAAPCGIFAGERRCGKAEAARYGYGGGRDPVLALVKLGTKLVSPDAELPGPR